MIRGKLVTTARIVLGLLFTLAGCNELLRLVPLPPMEGAAAQLRMGLEQTGYFFPLLGAIEVAAGLALLAGRWVPVALVVLAPIVLNVAAFHVALASAGMPAVVVMLVTGLALAWRHRDAFAPLLRPRPPTPPRGVRALELLLAFAFLASGAGGLVGRVPPPSTAGAAVMLHGLAAAGYFLPLLSALQVAAGILLLVRRWVGLAVLVLAPLVVQILAYRLYVATPVMLGVGFALVAAEVWLAYAYRDLFAPLFDRGSGPRPQDQDLREAPQLPATNP